MRSVRSRGVAARAQYSHAGAAHNLLFVARPAPERRTDLLALYRCLSPEHRCPLAETRTKIVFGSGNADADLMFVGEAPGASEDREGLPFVGRAGKLLDQLLSEIGLDRGQTFVANVLKCRPPGNRDPRPEEIEECSPHLFRQIELIEPRVVCTLGNFATKLLSGRPEGITRVHGQPQRREIAGRTVLLYPLFHPAAALRTEAVQGLLREDFARLPGLLAEEGGAQGGGEAEPAPPLAPGLREPPPPGAAADGPSLRQDRPSLREDSQLGLFGSPG